MSIIDVPPQIEELTSATHSDHLLNLYSSCTNEEQVQSTHPTNGEMPPCAEMSSLYKQIELRLESIVEKLLLSKVDENDNILASMQGVMERIFVASAMRIAQGNISRAARLLGINRNTLSKKLKSIGPGGD